MKKIALAVTILITLSLVLLPGCRQPVGPPSNDLIRGEALVSEIEILILESFPVQVHVIARGELPDSCTDIDTVTTGRDGNQFSVRITTARPRDEVCAQVITPFEEVIPLDVYGLAAGTYTVNVNGVTDTFTLTIDNVPFEE